MHPFTNPISLLVSGLPLLTITTALQHTHNHSSYQFTPFQQVLSPATIQEAEAQCPPPPARNLTRADWSLLGWDGPNDCLTTHPDYCIYTKILPPSTPPASGMVVISTEKSMLALSSYPLLSQQHNQKPAISPTSFYAAPVPGKGIGLIANRTIRKGEIIMRRRPSLLIQFDMPEVDGGPGAGNGVNEMTREERLAVYGRAVMGRMDEATRELFMGQVGDDLVDKVDRNAFRVFVGGDEGHLGSYPEVARFNHDCRPNLHYRITNLTHVTVAVRDIPEGEELTVSYIDGMIPHAERQERLAGSWGFKCACHACSQGLPEIAASDARVAEIAKLEAELEEKVGSGEIIPRDTPERLVRLYEEEMLDNYIAHALTKAALLSSMFADAEKTTEYATLAVEALEREYGPDTKDGDAMLALAQNPKEHWSWGIRNTGWRVL